MRILKSVGYMSILGLVTLSTAAVAQDHAAAAASSGGDVKMWLALAAGFGMAIASFGGALGQSKAISAAVDGISRNPGAAGKIFAPTLIVGLALIESLVLLAFVVTNGLAGKI
jgi:F-type H+-transporting ATPase subunit c